LNPGDYRLGVKKAKQEGRIHPPFRRLKHLLVSGGCGANPMEGGIGYLVGINPGSSDNQLLQHLAHFRVMRAVVGVGAFFLVPQAHGKGIGTVRRDERDFVVEPFFAFEAWE
jgi:hypothetical protein